MKCKNCGRVIEDNSLYCNWCGKYQLKQKRDQVTVPKPLQLPSGNWRIWLKPEKQSIVRSTPEACRAEALAVRKQWLKDEAEGKHEPPPKTVTLGEVLDNYINARSATLSPSTISGYQSIRDNRFKDHMDDDVSALNPQQIVNDEIAAGLGAKTIANAWRLCSSALRQAKVQFESPRLPRIVKHERDWLDYNQIQTFLKAIEGQPCELGALLALHSLRRSELFGLKTANYDAKKQIIHVRGAMLSTIQSGWVYSELNKNDTSQRDVPVIIPRLAELMKQLDRKSEFVIGNKQKNLYREINAVCASCGLPQPGIHGLRHSFASLAYHLGWKKLSTQQIGGWKNSKVVDEIYTHNADLDTDLETMRAYFVRTQSMTDLAES